MPNLTRDKLRERFGKKIGDGHRLFNVPWELAKPVIEAHIAQQKSRIAALAEKAKAELLLTGG